MLGKRGISPLIATVLLIGFAVALGVMIMSITQPLVKGSCDDVTIKTASFCKQGGKLFAIVENSEGVSVCKNIMIDTAAIEVTCPT
jgi:flagellin-like protein